jgi:hypothetical protein
MSVSTTAPGASPVPTLDVLELAQYLKRAIADPEHEGTSYTDEYTAKKTDLGATPGAAVTASRQVLNSDVHALIGWSIAETTGTAGATIRLWDGRNTTAEQFTRINLQPNESVRDWFIPRGIRCFTGAVFLQVIGGSVEGVVYWV